MEIAIIGLKQSGKSTLFEIMTGVNSSAVFNEKVVPGKATVPDRRFNTLVEIFKPKKVTPASLTFLDVQSADDGAWESVRQNILQVDGFIHIVDAFQSDQPGLWFKNYKDLLDELIFSDLVVVENKLERLKKLQKQSMKPEDIRCLDLMPKLKEALESGRPLRELQFSDADMKLLRGFSFWTMRPELLVLNTNDEPDAVNKIREYVGGEKEVIAIAVKEEKEIAGLDVNERGPFLKEMGVDEPAFEKIIRSAFSQMDKICYFTVGEDEVRAWIIPKGATAPQAAAAIHKDFERGFIKAEIVSYEDFMSSGKSINSAKAAGKLRLEGKEYIVKDADIISFRFNV